MEESEIENVIPVTNYIEYYRTERAKRADMLAMDTNKLIIRLEKLMSGLPHDPVKRRSKEKLYISQKARPCPFIQIKLDKIWIKRHEQYR